MQMPRLPATTLCWLPVLPCLLRGALRLRGRRRFHLLVAFRGVTPRSKSLPHATTTAPGVIVHGHVPHASLLAVVAVGATSMVISPTAIMIAVHRSTGKAGLAACSDACPWWPSAASLCPQPTAASSPAPQWGSPSGSGPRAPPPAPPHTSRASPMSSSPGL